MLKQKMRVRCERDGTAFDAIVQSYPSTGPQTKMYDKDGDRFIECPICGRRYFHRNGGTEIDPSSPSGGWYSDRRLTVY